ncbi:MAG: lipopolysaccharide heptosyltransferase I [Candidatus Rokubacteria bacterium]|nr:lipopolysaccharide heptosyltransferase I [Candidatus Rokubacteria bacterium]
MKPVRIAIVRLTSLGDVVHTLPVASAIRRHSPTSYIVWIVEEREQTLLRNNAVVDEVVVAPTRRWRHEFLRPRGAVRVLAEWRGLRERLRGLRLDVALDVQGLLKSTLFSVLTRAPMRIGFAWPHAREPLSSLFTTCWVTPPPGAVHMVEKNLSLLGPLGIPVEEIAFPIPDVPEAEARAGTFLRGHAITPQDRVVALIPATRRPRKQWPPAYYQRLAERLASRSGVRVLALAAPGEDGALRLVAGGLDGESILPYTGFTPDFVALLRRARLAIGNDTGPLHLAAALGVPTIGLYGPTRPEVNGPYGPRVRALRSPTGRMEDISVDTVFEVAMEWLA